MFDIENHGSICLIRPMTPDVDEWLRANVDPEAQWFGNALVVEPRYVGDLVEGLVAEGFVAS